LEELLLFAELELEALTELLDKIISSEDDETSSDEDEISSDEDEISSSEDEDETSSDEDEISADEDEDKTSPNEDEESSSPVLSLLEQAKIRRELKTAKKAKNHFINPPIGIWLLI